MADEEIDAALRQLGDSKWRVRLDAARTLARHGRIDDARTTYLQALEDARSVERAITDLGKIGPLWAIEPLAGLFSDEDANVRHEAILALLDVRRAAAAPWLLGVLRDEDDEKREDARVALLELFGDEVPVTGSSFETDDDECERVTDWWSRNAARFEPARCYRRGAPLQLDAWIGELAGASESRRVYLTHRLEAWTGVNLGGTREPELSARWAGWWRDNASRFVPGQRYFWAHPVVQ